MKLKLLQLLALCTLAITTASCGTYTNSSGVSAAAEERFETKRTASEGSLAAKLYQTLKKASQPVFFGIGAPATISDDGAGTVTQDLGANSYSCSWFQDGTYSCSFPGGRKGIPLTGQGAKDLLTAIKNTDVEHEYSSTLVSSSGALKSDSDSTVVRCRYLFLESGYTCHIIYKI